MGVIDIIIVICFLPAIYFGIKNGLVKQIIAIASIYFGITLSLRFADAVTEWMKGFVSFNPSWMKIVSFIIIFGVVAIVLNLLGKLLEKIIHVTLLGWLNRLLGILLSFALFAIIISTIIYFVDSANELIHFIPDEKKEASNFYPVLLDLSKKLFPYLKTLF